MDNELRLKELELALKAKELELKELELQYKLAEMQMKLDRSKKVDTLLKPITAPISLVSNVVDKVASRFKENNNSLDEAFISQIKAALQKEFGAEDEQNDQVIDQRVQADIEFEKRLGLEEGCIRKGVFVGSIGNLVSIIQAGENENFAYVEEKNIQRNADALQEFLTRHERSSIPVGFQIHYIRPLSRGGLDHADNMIIVSDEHFKRITGAQRSYYSRIYG